MAALHKAAVPLLSRVQQHELARIQPEMQLLRSSSSSPELVPHRAGGCDFVEGKKKPKGLVFREGKGQGLSQTRRVSQTPGRWGNSRGSDTGLKDYWELGGIVVSGGRCQGRALTGRGWGTWAGQEWDAASQDKGTVQLTGRGRCGGCVHRGVGGLEDLVVIAGKGQRNCRKHVGKGHETAIRRSLLNETEGREPRGQVAGDCRALCQ